MRKPLVLSLVLAAGLWQAQPATLPPMYQSVHSLVWVHLGDVAVQWIQPLQGVNAYSDFLARHGTGMFSLVQPRPRRAPPIAGAEVELLWNYR